MSELLNRVLSLFHSSESEDNIHAIEISEGESLLNDTRVVNEIKLLLDSEDFLVRISAIESIGDNRLDVESKQIYEIINNDENELVICTALMTLGLLNRQTDEIYIKNYIEKCIESKLIKVNAYFSFYLMGDRSALIAILPFIDNDDYHVRCSVINLSRHFVRDDDFNDVLFAVKQRSIIELTTVLKSSIDFFLSSRAN